MGGRREIDAIRGARAAVEMLALVWLGALASPTSAGAQAESLQATPPSCFEDLADRLRAAEGEEELDEILDQVEREHIALAQELKHLLDTSETPILKTRACYLIGVLRLGRAARSLVEEIELEDPTPVSDFGAIPRWGRYPCMEALVKIGKPAERFVIYGLATSEIPKARELMIEALFGFDRDRGRVERLLRSAMEHAEDEGRRKRLERALNSLDESPP